MTGLTKRQADILSFLIRYVEDNGTAPVLREIGKAFWISSFRGVTVHLDALERKGYIERDGSPAGIRIFKDASGACGSFKFVTEAA